MANYAVRIYDDELRDFVQAEAKRRNCRVSDVVELALRRLQTGKQLIVTKGSDAPVVEVPVTPSDPMRGGDAPDRGAVDADAAPREAVVQPVSAVDSGNGLEFETPLVLKTMTEVMEREQVQRVKGPDSGPDPLLGF